MPKSNTSCLSISSRRAERNPGAIAGTLLAAVRRHPNFEDAPSGDCAALRQILGGTKNVDLDLFVESSGLSRSRAQAAALALLEAGLASLNGPEMPTSLATSNI